jgi:hypothetical protein
MSDLSLLWQTNPGVLQEQRRRQSLEEMFKRQAEGRAQEQLAIQRDQNERLREKDRLESIFKTEENERKREEFKARMPLWEAEAETARANAETTRATAPAKIQETLAQAAERATRTQRERMGQAGTILNQAAVLAQSPGGRAAAKQFLQENGFGQFYDDRWDDPTIMRDDASIGKVLQMFGNQLTNSVAPFLQKQTLQDDAQAARAELEARKATEQRDRDARLAAERRQLEELKAQRRAELQRQIQTARAQAGQEPRNLNALAAQLMNAAKQEQDPEIRQMLEMEAAKVLDALRFIGAQPSQKPNINPAIAPDVLAPPTPPQNPLRTPQPGMPPPNPTVQPSTGSPAQQRPQTLADLQRLYPNVPPEKLREAYKKKFGIDLK